jgi:valyl-tRNA synthetase
MDTWATSSLTPQIVGRWLADRDDTSDRLYEKVFPMSLRPQAHEIIRTWAFYTIVKSHHHFGTLPWKEVAISGWGLAPEGTGKISKSRGGGPMGPAEVIEKHSADAVRYWAASTSLGKDSVISEEKIQMGAKLITKLWNIARFSQPFLKGYKTSVGALHAAPLLSPVDRWILSRTYRLVRRVTELFHDYDYATAKSEMEIFFWKDLADNYLEMSKKRLYEDASKGHEGAKHTLYRVLLATIKLFAPFMPYVTEEIYQGIFKALEGSDSIHKSAWPVADESLINDADEAAGVQLVEVATAIRRYKTEHNLPLGTELNRLQLATGELAMAKVLQESEADIVSVTRAKKVEVTESLDPGLEAVKADGAVTVALGR